MSTAQELTDQGWFGLCRALGWVLRSARYSSTAIVNENGELRVRKRRAVHAPFLISIGDQLLGALDTGVRVLPQRGWEMREREMHQRLRGAPIRVEADGTLVLPCLPGKTLATLLEDPDADEARGMRAIELAVAALAAFHRMGFTHGDAMAENVMVDLDGGVAHWFDFETMHDPDLPLAWRRADDLRALLATCLLRIARATWVDVLGLVVSGYADDEVVALLPASFNPGVRRPLPFHLGQAGLSRGAYREIVRLLSDRAGRRRPSARSCSSDDRAEHRRRCEGARDDAAPS